MPMILAPRQHSFAPERALISFRFFLKGSNAHVARKADWRFKNRQDCRASAVAEAKVQPHSRLPGWQPDIQSLALPLCADQIEMVLDGWLVVRDTPSPVTSARASQGFRAEAIASQMK